MQNYLVIFNIFVFQVWGWLEVYFPDGTIKDIEDADTLVAKSLGGKAYKPDNKAKTIKMIFPDGSIGDIPSDAVNGALKAGAKRLH